MERKEKTYGNKEKTYGNKEKTYTDDALRNGSRRNGTSANS